MEGERQRARKNINEDKELEIKVRKALLDTGQAR
jgi:hypothetical protein